MRRDPFQAIADPTRRAIINMLSRETLNLNSVAEKFNVSRPAISKHIKILSQCGLIEIRQKGRERFCEATLESLGLVSNWLNDYRSSWTGEQSAVPPKPVEEAIEEILPIQEPETKMTEVIGSIQPVEEIVPDDTSMKEIQVTDNSIISTTPVLDEPENSFDLNIQVLDSEAIAPHADASEDIPTTPSIAIEEKKLTTKKPKEKKAVHEISTAQGSLFGF